MWLLMKSDYRRLRVVSPLLMLAAILGLVAVLLPGIGVDRNGAARWIAVGGPIPPLQPSEFAKLALIIYVSAWLAGRGEHVKAFWTGFFPFVVLVGLVAGLVMLEPDLGTTIVIVVTTMTLVFVAGASLTHVAAFAGIGSVVASLLVFTGEYRADRIFAFISAEDDPSGRGFHTLQLLIALGSGGVHGLGLGASRQKFFYVPGAHTDGIFAIIGEELGFIGSAIVIALFAVLIIRGFRVILRARDDFGSLLAVGIVSWIAYQALINVGGITRTLPLTGIPLPFLSYGGAAPLAMLPGGGVLLRLSRSGADRKTLAQGRRQSISSWRRFKPDAVFATAGCARVPVAVAARLLRRPLVVYLPDVTPGWAVQLLARLATILATTSERARAHLPAAKTRV